jgi:pimeloyl-ACP methyl ester carboxylesterase
MSGIQVNHIELYYEIAGEGEPLLFIHGLGSSTRDWDAQVPELSKRYKVIAFDLRGHGQSDKPAGPYTVSLFASDAAGLLMALDAAPAHVVGISLVGGVALQLALDHPALIKTLTVVNSGPAVLADAEQTRRELEGRVAIVKQLGMRAMGQALAPRLFPNPEQAALRETFIERWTENDPRAYIDATMSMADWNLTDRLGEIGCPTLILASDQDYTPVAMKEAYVKLLPNARLVVLPDSHHAVTMEKPEGFNRALQEFLDGKK